MADYIVYSTPCCAFTQRVTTLLNHKNLKYTLEMVPNEKPDWFKEASPSGETPVIKHNDKYLADSLKIMEYIEEQQPEPKVFTEEAREALKFFEEEFRPAFSKVMIASAPPMQKEWRPKLMSALQKMEQMLAEKAQESESCYLTGSSYTAVDIAVTPFVVRFPHLKYYRDIELNATKFPHVVKYIQSVSTHPAFAAVAYPEMEVRKWYRPRINRLPPLSTNPLQHAAFRKRTSDLKRMAEQISGEHDFELFSNAFHRFDKVDATHYRFEEEVMFPFVEGTNEGQTKEAHHQHEELDKFNHTFLEMLEHKKVEEAKAAFLEFFPKFDAHWNTEESQLLPIVSKLEPADQFSLFKKVWRSSKMEEQIELCIYCLEVLEPVQIDQYVFNIWNVFTKDPEFHEDWRAVKQALQSRLKSETWDLICERNPEVLKELESPKPVENTPPAPAQEHKEEKKEAAPAPEAVKNEQVPAQEAKNEDAPKSEEAPKPEESKPKEEAKEENSTTEGQKEKKKDDKSKKSGGCCIVM